MERYHLSYYLAYITTFVYILCNHPSKLYFPLYTKINNKHGPYSLPLITFKSY